MRRVLPGVELPTWPPINADMSNIDEVQRFAATHEPNERFLKGFHGVMSFLCDPTVVFADGAPARIAEHLASGDPTALVMTHHSFFDAPDAAAGIRQHEVLHPIEGRTVTQASSDWFRIPGLDAIFYQGGAWPVTRDKDVRSHYKREGMAEDRIEERVKALKEERKDSNSQLRDVETGMVDRGLILTTFVEGTRNRDDPAVVQPVKNAIKKMLEGIENPERAKIIVMALDYGGARILPKRYLTPTLFVDMMDALPPEEVNQELQEFMQYCATSAIENRRRGAPLSTLGKIGAVGATLAGAAVADRLMSRG
jgi:acyltransferase-like protein